MNSKSKGLVVASAAIIAFMVFFTTVQYGLSTPITTPIAVKMDNSSSVNLASETLEENMPSTLIVDFNSPMYYLVIWRAYGGVIWIGHGSQQGIETQQGQIPWQNLAARVDETPSKDVILACYSAAILSYVSSEGEVALSLREPVDARVGALVVSYVFTGNLNALMEAKLRLQDLLNGNTTPILLGYFGPNEAFWAGVGITAFMIGLLAGQWIKNALRNAIVRGVGKAIAAGLGSQIAYIALCVAGVATGAMSPIACAVSIIPTALQLIWYVILALDWLEAILFAATLAALLAIGWVSWLNAIATAGSLISLAICISSDFLDDDDVASTFWG